MKRRMGFTIVELLVVVAMVVAMAALVGGAANNLRLRSQALTCASNLRQVFAVFQQYANEFGGYMPRDVGPEFSEFDHWSALVQKQLSAGDFALNRSRARIGVLQCPSHPSTGQVMETGFSMNGYMADPVDRPWGVVGMTIQGAVKRPSEVVYLVDVSDALPFVLMPGFIMEGTYRWVEYPEGPILTGLQTVFQHHNLPGGVQERVARDRHGRGRINALYMDGHVAMVRSGDLTMRDFNDGVRGNRRVVGQDR